MVVVDDTVIITLLLILLSFYVFVFWVSVWALFLELKHFWSDSDSLLPSPLLSGFLNAPCLPGSYSDVLNSLVGPCFPPPDHPVVSEDSF